MTTCLTYPDSLRLLAPAAALLLAEGEWGGGPSPRVLVPDQSMRSSASPGSRVAEKGLPPHSFVRVAREGVGSVIVESPQLTVVRAAAMLERGIAAGSIGRRMATLRLAGFVDQLCGGWCSVRHPDGTRETTYELDPVMSVASLGRYLDEAWRIDGLKLARRGEALAVDGFLSPMEAKLELLLCAPPRLGGLHLPVPAVNVPLELDRRRRRLMSHGRITPDLTFAQYGLILEYNGSGHNEPGRAAEDDRRVADYQACGLMVLPVRSRDLASEASVDLLMRKVIRLVAAGGGEREARNARLAMGRDGYAEGRRLLLRAF